jgi:hypothetical protein
MTLRPYDADGLPIVIGKPLYHFLTIGKKGFLFHLNREVVFYPTERIYESGHKLVGWLCRMGGERHFFARSLDITKNPKTLKKIAMQMREEAFQDHSFDKVLQKQLKTMAADLEGELKKEGRK